MATKPAAKKTTKKPAAKRPATQAKPVRAPKSTVSTTKVRTTKVASAKSFRRAQATPFLTFRVTDQTVYWIVLSFIVLMLGIWVTMINVKVQRIYDQIDENNTYLYSTPDVQSKKQ